MRARAERLLAQLREYAGRAWRAIVAARAELLLSIAILGGWASLTAFVALLWRPAVWALSAGLLLLSLCGWRYLGRLVWDGLYALTREASRGA